MLEVITFILVIASLLPVALASHWSVRFFDFPRLQILALALFTMVWSLVDTYFSGLSTVFYITFLALLSVVIYQSKWVLPYTVLATKEVKYTTRYVPSSSIRILSSNVLQTNSNYDDLLSQIDRYQPDLVITLESDRKWQKALSSLKKSYLYQISVPQDNLYGMHLYSRYKLENTDVMYRVKEDVPSICTDVILPSGTRVKACFLHPMPPSPTESPSSQSRDEELILVAKELKTHSGPCVVAGDLNDVAWSRSTVVFRKISGLLDPRIGRGVFNTFHASIPVVRWPLDHIFISHHFTLNKIQRLPSIGSDHFPMFIDIQYQGEDSRRSGEVGNQSEELVRDEKALVDDRVE